jgi:hypothetical protein
MSRSARRRVFVHPEPAKHLRGSGRRSHERLQVRSGQVSDSATAPLATAPLHRPHYRSQLWLARPCAPPDRPRVRGAVQACAFRAERPRWGGAHARRSCSRRPAPAVLSLLWPTLLSCTRRPHWRLVRIGLAVGPRQPLCCSIPTCLSSALPPSAPTDAASPSHPSRSPPPQTIVAGMPLRPSSLPGLIVTLRSGLTSWTPN